MQTDKPHTAMMALAHTYLNRFPDRCLEAIADTAMRFLMSAMIVTRIVAKRQMMGVVCFGAGNKSGSIGEAGMKERPTILPHQITELIKRIY